MRTETSNTTVESIDAAVVRRWVLAAQTGDEAAYGELVKTYYQRVYGLLLGMVRRPEDAADLAQQVWIKVWRKLHTFKGDADFYTWVYRVATFAGLDFIRKRNRQREVDWPDESQWPQDAAGHLTDNAVARPDAAAVTEEVWASFDAALGTLSAEHRAALVLREVEGLSYDEIAKVMRCRRGTVMSRLYYARRKIQEYMKDWR